MAMKFLVSKYFVKFYQKNEFEYFSRLTSLLIIGIIGLKFSHIQASDKAGEGAFHLSSQLSKKRLSSEGDSSYQTPLKFPKSHESSTPKEMPCQQIPEIAKSSSGDYSSSSKSTGLNKEIKLHPFFYPKTQSSPLLPSTPVKKPVDLSSKFNSSPASTMQTASTLTSSSLPKTSAVKPDALKDDKKRLFREDAEKDSKTTQLNIYLLKKHSAVFSPPEVFEDARVKLKNFPWQFFNANKYHLVGAEHQKEYFIDWQLYTDITGRNGEEIYIFQETGTRQTCWTDIVYQQTKKHRESERTRNVLFEGTQYREPKGAIAFIRKDISGEDRFFAVTFGPTGRFLLNLDQCDASFAKHYAYNILSSLPTYKAQAYSEINLDEKKLTSEQAKRQGRVEVSRGVRAVVPKALTVTDGQNQICSFLGSHICVRSEFAFDTVGEFCRQYLQEAQKDNYKQDYGHIDFFNPLEDQDKIDKIFEHSLDSYTIEIPFESDGDSQSQTSERFKLKSKSVFRTNFPQLRESYNDFSCFANDLKKFINSNFKGLQRASRSETLKKLKELKITAINAAGQIIGLWGCDHLISATVSYAGKTFWVEAGEVFEVDKDFINMINNRLNQLFIARTKFSDTIENTISEDSSLVLLSEFTNADRIEKTGKNGRKYFEFSEGAYSTRIQEAYPEHFVLCDAKNISIRSDTNSHSQVEPCDLLSNECELIHLKRWSQGSAPFAYLVTQAVSSATLLVNSKEFRDKVSKKLPENKKFDTARKKLIDKEFCMVLGLIYPKEEFIPSMLPFNAKLALYKGCLALEDLGVKWKFISIRDDSDTSTLKSSLLPLSGSIASQSSSTNREVSHSLHSVKRKQSTLSFPSKNNIGKEGLPNPTDSTQATAPTPSLAEIQVGSTQDTLEGFDFDNLQIKVRENIKDLPVRNIPIHIVGIPQEVYKIDAKDFRRQNVSGTSMRCFFNAVGLVAETEIAKLKSCQNDPIVRYMIANEIVSAAADPEQLPKDLKEAIDYSTYQTQRMQIDALETERSTQLVMQNTDSEAQNPDVLPESLRYTKVIGDEALNELRLRSLALEAYNTFLDKHIGNEQMMVSLNDVKGDVKENSQANYTSIDAVAYINNIGLKIFQPTREGSLRLAHQFIPEDAREIAYLYHHGVHFQALVSFVQLTDQLS